MIRNILNKTLHWLISIGRLCLREAAIPAPDETGQVQMWSPHRKWDNAGLHSRLQLDFPDEPWLNFLFFCRQHSQGSCESQERWHYINALPWCWPALPSLLFPSPLTIYFRCIFKDQMFKVEDVDHSWVSKNTLHEHASQSSCCWYTWNIYCAPEVGNYHCSISRNHYTENIPYLLNRILPSCL